MPLPYTLHLCMHCFLGFITASQRLQRVLYTSLQVKASLSPLKRAVHCSSQHYLYPLLHTLVRIQQKAYRVQLLAIAEDANCLIH